ncbi:hypothetical protein P59_133 [Bacillus phage P59]|nr:hypothetical protein P59_133 [Bacillus phage P59]
MQLMIKVIKPFGYWIEEHKVGEIFSVNLRDVTNLIQEGLAEIVVNNMDNNLPYDEDEEELFEPVPVEAVKPESKVPQRGPREPFWGSNGTCIDCGGNVDYYGPINTISCDTCTNEITEWM